MASVRDLVLVIRGRDEATRVVAGLGRHINRLGDHGQNAALRMSLLGTAATGAGLAIASAMKASARDAIEFDTAMRHANTVLKASEESAGGVASEFDKMGSAVLRLSTVTTRTATELADGLYFAASAGFTAAESIELLSTAAVGADAGFADLPVTMRGLVTTLRAFGLEADQASKVMDVLFKAVELGIPEFEELVTNMGKFIPTAAAFTSGLPTSESFEFLRDAAAGYTAVGLSGLNAAEGATAFNRVLVDFLKPSDELLDTLHEMNFVSGEQFVRTFEGASGAMAALAVATGGNVTQIRTLFPNIRALRGFLAATANEGTTLARVFEQMKQSEGAAFEAFEVRSKGLEFALDNLRNTAKALSIGFGSELIKPIAQTAEILQKVLDTFNKFSDGARANIVRAIGFASAWAILGGAIKSVQGVLLSYRAVRNLANLEEIVYGNTLERQAAEAKLAAQSQGGLAASVERTTASTERGALALKTYGVGAGQTIKAVRVASAAVEEATAAHMRNTEAVSSGARAAQAQIQAAATFAGAQQKMALSTQEAIKMIAAETASLDQLAAAMSRAKTLGVAAPLVPGAIGQTTKLTSASVLGAESRTEIVTAPKVAGSAFARSFRQLQIEGKLLQSQAEAISNQIREWDTFIQSGVLGVKAQEAAMARLKEVVAALTAEMRGGSAALLDQKLVTEQMAAEQARVLELKEKERILAKQIAEANAMAAGQMAVQQNIARNLAETEAARAAAAMQRMRAEFGAIDAQMDFVGARESIRRGRAPSERFGALLLQSTTRQDEILRTNAAGGVGALAGQEAHQAAMGLTNLARATVTAEGAQRKGALFVNRASGELNLFQKAVRSTINPLITMAKTIGTTTKSAARSIAGFFSGQGMRILNSLFTGEIIGSIGQSLLGGESTAARAVGTAGRLGGVGAALGGLALPKLLGALGTTIAPGVGTAIGAGVGALAGGAISLLSKKAGEADEKTKALNDTIAKLAESSGATEDQVRRAAASLGIFDKDLTNASVTTQRMVSTQVQTIRELEQQYGLTFDSISSRIGETAAKQLVGIDEMNEAFKNVDVESMLEELKKIEDFGADISEAALEAIKPLPDLISDTISKQRKDFDVSDLLTFSTRQKSFFQAWGQRATNELSRLFKIGGVQAVTVFQDAFDPNNLAMLEDISDATDKDLKSILKNFKAAQDEVGKFNAAIQAGAAGLLDNAETNTVATVDQIRSFLSIARDIETVTPGNIASVLKASGATARTVAQALVEAKIDPKSIKRIAKEFKGKKFRAELDFFVREETQRRVGNLARRAAKGLQGDLQGRTISLSGQAIGIESLTDAENVVATMIENLTSKAPNAVENFKSLLVNGLELTPEDGNKAANFVITALNKGFVNQQDLLTFADSLQTYLDFNKVDATIIPLIESAALRAAQTKLAKIAMRRIAKVLPSLDEKQIREIANSLDRTAALREAGIKVKDMSKRELERLNRWLDDVLAGERSFSLTVKVNYDEFAGVDEDAINKAVEEAGKAGKKGKKKPTTEPNPPKPPHDPGNQFGMTPAEKAAEQAEKLEDALRSSADNLLSSVRAMADQIRSGALQALQIFPDKPFGNRPEGSSIRKADVLKQAQKNRNRIMKFLQVVKKLEKTLPQATFRYLIEQGELRPDNLESLQLLTQFTAAERKKFVKLTSQTVNAANKAAFIGATGALLPATITAKEGGQVISIKVDANGAVFANEKGYNDLAKKMARAIERELNRIRRNRGD